MTADVAIVNSTSQRNVNESIETQSANKLIEWFSLEGW